MEGTYDEAHSNAAAFARAVVGGKQTPTRAVCTMSVAQLTVDGEGADGTAGAREKVTVLVLASGAWCAAGGLACARVGK
eukprot:2508923-Pleurochrysis_carterae.AAC.2